MSVPAILGGGDFLVASHTGSGKTLAYLLPMVRRRRAAGAAHAVARPDRALSRTAAAGRPRLARPPAERRAGGWAAAVPRRPRRASAASRRAAAGPACAPAPLHHLLSPPPAGQIEQLKRAEAEGAPRRARRPRMLVLGPTKELVEQLTKARRC
jgi:hypothetical protein